MMSESETIHVINQAVQRGYLQPVQAELLKEELAMFPISGSIISHMVRKGMMTLEQGQDLMAPADEVDEPPAAKLPSNPRLPRGEQLNPEPGTGRTTPSNVGLPRASEMPSRQTQRPHSITEAVEISRKALSTPRPQGSSSSGGMRPAQPPLRGESKVYDIDAPVTSGTEVSVPGASAASPATDPQLLELFKLGRERGCSDLHLTVDKPPYLRQEGRLLFVPGEPLTSARIQEMAHSVLTPAQQQTLKDDRQVDFAFEAPGLGRYRANIYHQRLGVEAAFRFIPEDVPTLQSLGMPPVLEKLTTYTQGLNLVTGPGGSGKTTTVAAMLEFINMHRHEHIITVEDPVEYVFQPKACQITQREVGTHTNSFGDALRTALRQDPDVIMIGELRDLDTTSISITAAETGHLVFGTLHTAGAIRTVARILDVYPPNQRQQICMMVADSLRGIISQQLLPRKDEQGRVCAMEILVATTGVSQVIKEGKTHQLVSHMQSGRKLGMKSMDDALMELLQAGVISGNTAYNHAENKPAFEMLRSQ